MKIERYKKNKAILFYISYSVNILLKKNCIYKSYITYYGYKSNLY